MSGDQLQREFGYVVVEEIVLEEVRTVLSAWPSLAPHGQLRFEHPEAADEYVDPRAGIEGLLNERRLLFVSDELTFAEMKERPVEVGDVYAIRLTGRGGVGGGDGGDGGRRRSLVERALPEGAIYDITADARLAATATYSAATAGPLDSADARRFFDDGESGPEGGPPVPVPEGPGGEGPGGGTESLKDKPQESITTVVAEETVAQPDPVQRQQTAGAE